MKAIDLLVRENIKKLVSYKSARSESAMDEGVFLDANENPYQELGRYPDPFQRKLKETISSVKGISDQNIFLGNGSDEIIDLLIRIFCVPGQDKIMTFSPTYGMYKVYADINNVETIEVKLGSNFQLDLSAIKEQLSDERIRVAFLCSPNNPTGNLIELETIFQLLKNFEGIVVMDEAYIDFSKAPSWMKQINRYPNLVVLQTLSKAWGLAGVRIGMAFTNSAIIRYLNKVKPPYNLSVPNQKEAIQALENETWFSQNLNSILEERDVLQKQLLKLNRVKQVFPSEANFLLVRFQNAIEVYQQLSNAGIVVRNRSSLIDNCLRISIGTPDENEKLINELKRIDNEKSIVFR